MTQFDAEAALRRLVDEADVSQVILHYADGVDRRQFDRVWACFAPDAYVSGSTFSGPLDEYLPRLLAGVETFGATQHFMGNQLITVEGDRAHTETYAVARHFRDAEGKEEVIVMGVRYVDDLIRQTDGRWVIHRRDATAMWQRP